MDQAPGNRDEETGAQTPPVVRGPQPGERLREARAARGESVEDVATALHLMPAQIRALEADDYASFAAPIFVSGNIRKYAVHLGLDPAEVLAALDPARLETPPIRSELTARFPAPPRRGLPPELRIAAGVIAGVVVLATLWYLLRTPLVIETPATDRAVPGIAAPDSATPDSATLAPRATAPSPGAPAPAAPEGPMDELVLNFSGSSWVEVVDVTGRRLAFRMGADGDVLTLRGLAPFDILLGNAPNVAIDYNGAPYRDFPVSRQNVASFRLDRPGAEAEPPPGEEP
jgi:cytoskeleton protein RodZ